MDGIGVTESKKGNAVAHATTPSMDQLKREGLYTTLEARGHHVGLANPDDLGGSEVGHNTMGAGQIYPQGASLVDKALSSGTIFQTNTWHKLIAQTKSSKISAKVSNHHLYPTTQPTLHFLGLLSDGGLHSHQDHLHQLMAQAAKEGATRQRLHVLLDGRDVPPHSAQRYLQTLEDKCQTLMSRYPDADIRIASGGGRMKLTMDRYEADWTMVYRGWCHHVKGEGTPFLSAMEALKTLREQNPQLSDQDLPGFVITDASKNPIGTIEDGDGVVCFNFRADRAVEISRAFTETDFSRFPRGHTPDVFYCSLVLYDGDLNIPPNYLVHSPPLPRPLSQVLSERGLRQFACSETQKFGHVTFFWNGNRSGKWDDQREEYLQIPSHSTPITPDQQPWMKSHEITEATIQRLYKRSFDFLRINFAGGDMVGHTGDLHAATVAVSVVDLMLGRLMHACKETQTTLVVTADHGNCEEMYQPSHDPTDSHSSPSPIAKTSHTLNPVPLYIWGGAQKHWKLRHGKVVHKCSEEPTGGSSCKTSHGSSHQTPPPDHLVSPAQEPGLAHIAATLLDLLGEEKCDHFLPSLIEKVP